MIKSLLKRVVNPRQYDRQVGWFYESRRTLTPLHQMYLAPVSMPHQLLYTLNIILVSLPWFIESHTTETKPLHLLLVIHFLKLKNVTLALEHFR